MPPLVQLECFERIFLALPLLLGALGIDLAAFYWAVSLNSKWQKSANRALIAILPKYSVSQVVGFIKGKRAIAIARTYLGRRKNFTGQSFWARGYDVSTVGRDEAVVRQYSRDKEKEDQRLDPLTLWRGE